MSEGIMDRRHKENEKGRKQRWKNTITQIEIGGLGNIKKKAIRFNYYTVEEVDGKPCVVPEFDVDNKPKESELYYITGQELLVSLHNLYEKINIPTSDKPFDYLITEWCKRHTHPYNVQDILNEIEAIDNDQSFHNAQRRLEYYSSFGLTDFIRDLSNISNALDLYVAITDLQTKNDGRAARALYYEGKFFDTLPFFEKHRNESMKLDDEILLSYASLFPELQMILEYNLEKKKFELAPVVKSVFDIAWYTLSCMSGMVGGMENGYSKLPVGRCECCNMLIVKTGRRKFCDDSICQAYRNNRKSNAYLERQKLESSMFDSHSENI